MRAALYVRQSKDANLTGLAVERQREDCLKLCRQHGWTVVEVFEENDTSASKAKVRPVYARMMQAAENGAFDVIVAWHVDRLTRKLADLEDLITRTQRHSVRIATVNGELDLSNDTGRLIGRILASVAAGEVERKSARQKRAAAQAAEKGAAAAGPRPFGYDDDRTQLRAREADALRSAYRSLLAGETLSSIGRALNDAGHSTTRGGPWRHNSVRATLLNPRNAGLRSFAPLDATGRPVRREIVAQGTWPAIVDEATWRAAVALLSNPARKTNRVGNTRRWLLTSLAFCGACAPDRETHVISTYRDSGRRVYRCQESAHLLRFAPPIDELVETATIARLSRSDAGDLLVEDDEGNADDLRAAAGSLRARLDGLAQAFAAGTIDLRQLELASSDVRRQLADVEARQAASARGFALYDLVTARDVAAVWHRPGFGVQRRRSAVDALWRVTILRAGPGRRVFDPASVQLEPKL